MSEVAARIALSSFRFVIVQRAFFDFAFLWSGPFGLVSCRIGVKGFETHPDELRQPQRHPAPFAAALPPLRVEKNDRSDVFVLETDVWPQPWPSVIPRPVRASNLKHG
jgi:hypothetical protein